MKRTIKKIVTFAIGFADPQAIILFGSVARGTNHLHSDLDLLIVTETDCCWGNKQIGERVQQFAQELSLKADILVYPRMALEKALEDPCSFLAASYYEGKMIYKKSENCACL